VHSRLHLPGHDELGDEHLDDFAEPITSTRWCAAADPWSRNYPPRSQSTFEIEDSRASGDGMMPRMSINVENGRPIQARSLPFRIVLILELAYRRP
jgi:hypothetical protein